jgi:hypothetical protein
MIAWFRNKFARFVALTHLTRPGVSLRELGYPTHEELAAVGLTGRDFMDLYIYGTSPRGCRDPRQFAQKVLRKFYSDYPQLAPRERTP